MKKYMTIEVDKSIEKESIELIWRLIENENLFHFSNIIIKIKNSIVDSILFENDYETIEKKYSDK
ncbi:MAG: hypothetical protein ACRCWM_11110, partial [Sarcina sp.]